METIEVTIVEFDKYKGRADVQHNSWFRCSNRILEDQVFFDFTHEEVLVWIYLMSISSQANHATIHVSLHRAHHVCRLRPEAVKSAIKKLSKFNIIKIPRIRSVRGRYVDDTRTCATDRQTDRQNITHTTADPEVGVRELEEIYEKYPRKEGKTRGIAKLRSSVKNLQDLEEFKKAVDNYTQHLKKSQTEKQYIKHFSTFVGEWRDWLEERAGESVDVKKKSRQEANEAFIRKVEAERAAKTNHS